MGRSPSRERGLKWEYWIVDPAKQRTTVYYYEEDAAPMIYLVRSAGCRWDLCRSGDLYCRSA